MHPAFFYLFAAMAVGGGTALVAFRNPVSSAMSMVVCFIGLAALFMGLNAYFVGIIQILVYAGAIMVLFLFIIMLLDLKGEASIPVRAPAVATAVIIPAVFLVQLLGVLQKTPAEEPGKLALKAAAVHFQEGTVIHETLTDAEDPSLPDVHLIGHTLFNRYNFPLQVVGVILLVATIGVVVLSKRPSSAGGARSSSE